MNRMGLGEIGQKKLHHIQFHKPPIAKCLWEAHFATWINHLIVLIMKHNITRCKMSSRIKKPPVTKSDDFFMVNSDLVHFSVLHQNMQSMRNKVLDLDLVLKSKVQNIDVLCLTEHWIKGDYLTTVRIEQYKLVSHFGRTNHNYGGSCIYVKNNISTKEVNFLQGISVEKDFEMSVSEVVTYDYIIVCIYRSPDGNFRVFLKNLELVIEKIQAKSRKLLLCGDWNLNFLKDDTRIQELKKTTS
jgi:hypothetical protein